MIDRKSAQPVHHLCWQSCIGNVDYFHIFTLPLFLRLNQPKSLAQWLRLSLKKHRIKYVILYFLFMLLFISVISLIILFLVNFTVERKGFYGRFSWFDKVMHFFGGFFVAMFWSGLTHFLLLIISLTLLVGFAWEIYEYFLGTYKQKRLGTKKYKIDMRDTVEDLFFDFIGAIIWVFILWAFT